MVETETFCPPIYKYNDFIKIKQVFLQTLLKINAILWLIAVGYIT
jgi:hypothetical protein